MNKTERQIKTRGRWKTFFERMTRRDAGATYRRHDEFISSSDSRWLGHEKGRASRERTGKRERGVRARRDANVQEEKKVCGARAGKKVGPRRGNICRVQQSRTPAVW